MAWLDYETRTGIYQIGFTFDGHRFKRSLRTRNEQVAEATLHRGRMPGLLILVASITIGALAMVHSQQATADTVIKSGQNRKQ